MHNKGDIVYHNNNNNKGMGVVHSTYLYSVLVQFPHSKNPKERNLYKDVELTLVLHPSWENRYL